MFKNNANFIDLTGRSFDRLTVLFREPNRKGRAMWRCRCSCGGEKSISGKYIRSKHTTSCGCRSREAAKLRHGEKNLMWKGGTSLNEHGYRIFSAGEYKGVFEHRVVMAKFLGRPLLKTETVHHKNGVKDDNRIDNLELWSSYHSSGQKVADLTEWAVQHLKTYAPEFLK